MQPLLSLQPSNTTAKPKYFSYSVRWTLVPISVGRCLSLQRRFIRTANLITGPRFHVHTLLFSTLIYPVLLWYESVLCNIICNRCQIWSDQAMKASTDEFLYVSRICRWLIAFSRLVPHLRFLLLLQSARSSNGSIASSRRLRSARCSSPKLIQRRRQSAASNIARNQRVSRTFRTRHRVDQSTSWNINPEQADCWCKM